MSGYVHEEWCNVASCDCDAEARYLSERLTAAESERDALKARVAELEKQSVAHLQPSGVAWRSRAEAAEARVKEVEADAKECSVLDDAAHRLLDEMLGEGTPGDTSMETMVERLPRLKAKFDKQMGDVFENLDLNSLSASLAAARKFGDEWHERAQAAAGRVKEVEAANATLVAELDAKHAKLVEVDKNSRAYRNGLEDGKVELMAVAERAWELGRTWTNRGPEDERMSQAMERDLAALLQEGKR